MGAKWASIGAIVLILGYLTFFIFPFGNDLNSSQISIIYFFIIYSGTNFVISYQERSRSLVINHCFGNTYLVHDFRFFCSESNHRLIVIQKAKF